MSSLTAELRAAALRVQGWLREHGRSARQSGGPVANLVLLIRGSPHPEPVAGPPEVVKGGLLRFASPIPGAVLLVREDEVQGFVAYVPPEEEPGA